MKIIVFYILLTGKYWHVIFSDNALNKINQHIQNVRLNVCIQCINDVLRKFYGKYFTQLVFFNTILPNIICQSLTNNIDSWIKIKYQLSNNKMTQTNGSFVQIFYHKQLAATLVFLDSIVLLSCVKDLKFCDDVL